MAAQTLTDALYTAADAIVASPAVAVLPDASLSKSILATSIFDRHTNRQQQQLQQQQQQQQLAASMLIQSRACVVANKSNYVAPPTFRHLCKSETGTSASLFSLPGGISGIGLVIPSHPLPASLTPGSHTPADRRKPTTKPGFCDDGQAIPIQFGGPTVPLGGRHIWGKTKPAGPNMAASSVAAAVVAAAASAAAASAAASAAAYGHRPQGILLCPSGSSSSASQYIPGQSMTKGNSITGTKEMTNCIATNAIVKRYQGKCIEASSSSSSSSSSLLASPYGVVSNQLRTSNGWSNASGRDQQPGDDQPLDLSSMKRKRFQETSSSDDCPLDLSTKKPRLENGFNIEVQPQLTVVGQGQCIGYYGGQKAIPTQTRAGELDSKLSPHRPSYDEVYRQRSTLNSVLVPPISTGMLLETTRNRQILNPRPRTGTVPPRLPYAMSNSFQMFPNRNISSESSVQPVQHALSSSGSRSGATGYSLSAAESDTTNSDAITNPYPLSCFQQQQQQQTQRQLHLLNGCNSTSQTDNTPNIPDSEISLLDGYDKDIANYSIVSNRSTTVLELNSQYRDIHSAVTSSIPRQQQQPQLQQHGAKNSAVSFTGCSDMISKQVAHNYPFATNSPESSSLLHSIRPSSRGSQTRTKLLRNVTPQALASDADAGVVSHLCGTPLVDSLQVLESDTFLGRNRGGHPAPLASKAHVTSNKRQIKRTKSQIDGEASKYTSSTSSSTSSSTFDDSEIRTPLHSVAVVQDAQSISDACKLGVCQEFESDRKPENNERPANQAAIFESKQDVVDLKDLESNIYGTENINSIKCRQNWTLDSDGDSRWPLSSLSALCTDSSNPTLSDLSIKSYVVVAEDRLETVAAKNEAEVVVPGEIIKISATSLASQSVKVDETFARKETDLLPSNGLTMAIEDRSSQEMVTRDVLQQSSIGCEECRRKHNERGTVLIPSSCLKILASCRDCESREACGLSGSGDMMPRTCRVFDRQARRVPVANVQPFMKETLEAAAKTSGDPSTSQPSSAKAETNSSELDEAEATTKTPTPVGLKELPAFSRNQGDTPHHMEFVRFLGMKVEEAADNESSNPFRTPVGKLHDRLKSCTADGGRETDGDDKGRIRRQLLLDLAGPKGGRQKNSAPDGRREGGALLGFESMKKTPIEYIDDDNAVETTKEKRKRLAGRTSSLDGRTQSVPPKKQPQKVSSMANEATDSMYRSSALYQTMQALDRQTEDDRIMSSLHSNRSGVAKPSLATGRSLEDLATTDEVERASEFCPDGARFLKRKPNKKKDPSSRDELFTGPLNDGIKAVNERSSGAPSTDETKSNNERCNEFPPMPKSAPKRKYKSRKTLEGTSEGKGKQDVNHSIAYPVGSQSSISANLSSSSKSLFCSSSSLITSSSSTPEVSPTKKRKRIVEATPRDATGEVVLSSGSDARSILSDSLSVEHRTQFLHLTSASETTETTETTTCRRRGRGGATHRRGGIIGNDRSGSDFDRYAEYKTELQLPVYRCPPVRRGHRRGGRAAGAIAARHRDRSITNSHDRHLLELNSTDLVSGDFYGAAEMRDLQPEEGRLRANDETAGDLYGYDDTSESFDANRRGQGRKPVCKNGRIALQYPEVFGRRRARGGLRGRSKPIRGSMTGAGVSGVWTLDEAKTESHFCDETTGIKETEFYRDKNGNDSTVGSCHNTPSTSQLPPAAVAVRGKVRSRVRMTGRGSRGHPGAPLRYNSFVSDSGPSSSAIVLGRDNSETRLHQVTRLGYDELVSYYLTTGIIHPNVQDNSGVTPLHDSCSHGQLNITRMLLDHGAHPNSKALDGTRPLHLAVANDRIEIVRLLLSCGADIAMTNSAGRSPLQMTKTREMRQMLRGFVSDLSSGKGKELPWQFPASFDTNPCDLLSDAPSDEETESAEISFDLEEHRSPLVHRFFLDSQKSLRNFHSVADLCRDVKVEDFLLLNGDLTFVHISTALQSDVLTPSASSLTVAEASQQQTARTPDKTSTSWSPSLNLGLPSVPTCYQRILGSETEKSSFVEIDSNLKELLEICVQKIPAFVARPRSSFPVGISAARKKGKVGSENSSTVALATVAIATVAVATGAVVPSDSERESKVCTTVAVLHASTIPSSSTSSSPISASESLGNQCDPNPKAPGQKTGTDEDNSLSEANASVDQTPEVKGSKKLGCSHFPVGISLSPFLPPPPLLHLPDSVGETRVAFESCRIVLRDISIQPAGADVSATKCSTRKEMERTSSVSGVVEERKLDRHHPMQDDDGHASVKSPPVGIAGCSMEKASKDVMPVGSAMSCTMERRCGPNRHGSLERNPAHGCSGSVQPHPHVTTFGDARRRPGSKYSVDTASSSSSSSSSSSASSSSSFFSSSSSSVSLLKSETTAQPETLIPIPVLEKHGSDDEAVPVEKDEDECGESFDDEREMPQLTLYA